MIPQIVETEKIARDFDLKKNVWIINHYASDMYVNEGGRHYWLAKELKKKGYKPVIFCANTLHTFKDSSIEVMNNWKIEYKEGIPFVFIKCSDYQTNGTSRIRNMFSFYRKIIKYADYSHLSIDKPDIIYASSVHPLALIAGIKLAKKYNIETISEVRDLWPESIVAYGKIKKRSLIARILYSGERWIYNHSDKIIMTWEGGGQYIKDQGWSEINQDKIYHICNGVVNSEFHENKKNNPYKNKLLDDLNKINIVYTGSIRLVNNIDFLLDVAKEISNTCSNVEFLIFGSGNEIESLRLRVKNENIRNVEFMGHVEKKFIPSILAQSDINILHNRSTRLDIYGQSQNKLFEYLAANRPIIQTYKTNYSIIAKYRCGITCQKQEVPDVVEAIMKLVNDDKLRQEYAKNTEKAVNDYDYVQLGKKLIEVIEN